MPNVAFQEYIHTLHIQFQEGKLTDKTPHNLIVAIEDRIRILQHAGEWDTTPTLDINPMALLSAPTDTIPPTMKAYFDQQLHNYLRSLGQWVNLHQTQTHIDGFRHPRARVPSNLLPPDQQQPNPRFQPHQRNSHPGTLPAFPRAPRPTQTPQPRPFVNIAHESPADPITDPSSNNETPITPEQLCLAADIENCFDLLDYEAA